MPHTKSLAELVDKLAHAGRRPEPQLVEMLLAHGAAANEPLLGLATSIPMLYEEEPRCWGPLHALRLLGEQPDTAFIAPLLRSLPVPLRYEGDNAPETWAIEVLEIIGTCGAVAVPLLWEWSADTANSQPSRGAAVQALIYVVERDEAQYEPVVAEARRRLAETDEPPMAAFLISLLASLHVADAYAEVLAAYRAGRVDTTFFSAADARQGLLHRPHAHAANPPDFWERYDLYGPFEDQ